ncbi:MAG: hypothetical protein V3V01_19155 [Acidimicrobiales bacterium]
MSKVVVIDDEPAYRAEWSSAVAAGVEIVSIDRPRRLEEIDDLAAITHAVVDLSFGRWNLDGSERVPELETGVDAILTLREAAPSVEIVVVTRLDTAILTEMAIAIRQTWPNIRFLHKEDPRVGFQLRAFACGEHYQDNAEIALDLLAIEPIEFASVRTAIAAVSNSHQLTRTAQALASYSSEPNAAEVGSSLGWSPRTVTKRVSELRDCLRVAALPLPEREGFGGIWLWSFARGPMLRQL